MTNPVALGQLIDNIVNELYALDLLNYFNHSIVDKSSNQVSWVRVSDQPLIANFKDFTISDYFMWVERRDYTAMLHDGSLLQLTYQISDGEISGHRLCYVPNPIADRREVVGESIYGSISEAGIWESTVDNALERLEQDPLSVGLRSLIRFDYDPSNAKEGHPASHLTLNNIDCRIPCVDAMTPVNFIDFVYSNFYPQIREKYRNYFDNLHRWRRSKQLFTDVERLGVHLNWGG